MSLSSIGFSSLHSSYQFSSPLFCCTLFSPVLPCPALLCSVLCCSIVTCGVTWCGALGVLQCVGVVWCYRMYMLYHFPSLFRSHLYNFFVSFLSFPSHLQSNLHYSPHHISITIPLNHFLHISNASLFPNENSAAIQSSQIAMTPFSYVSIYLIAYMHLTLPYASFLSFPSFSILILFSYSFHMIFDHSLFLYISSPSPSIPVPALLFILIHSLSSLIHPLLFLRLSTFFSTTLLSNTKHSLSLLQ